MSDRETRTESRAMAPCRLAAAALVMVCLGIGAAAAKEAAEAKPDLELLEKRWHKCVRQSFSGQSAVRSTHEAQRMALAECKPAEDAYVTAMLVAQSLEADARRQSGESFGTKAKSWASSVLSYVVDPVTSWIQTWRR